MIRILAQWVLNAVSLLIVTRVIPGFVVRGFSAALIAALVIGLVNSTIGLVLKLLTFPLTILTLGIFLLVINAMMLMFASSLVPGFQVRGFAPALIAAILLALLHALWGVLLGE